MFTFVAGMYCVICEERIDWVFVTGMAMDMIVFIVLNLSN